MYIPRCHWNFLKQPEIRRLLFVDNIGKEGSALYISSLKLEQAEENLKGFMEVSYCHEQKK